MRECPECSVPIPRAKRFQARFGRIECPHCRTLLRADIKTFIVILYTILTALMSLGVWWSTRIGCFIPLVAFAALWIAGELLAGLLSPIKRAGDENP